MRTGVTVYVWGSGAVDHPHLPVIYPWPSAYPSLCSDIWETHLLHSSSLTLISKFMSMSIPFFFIKHFIYLFLIYFIDSAVMVIPFFSPLYSSLLYTPLPPSFPHLSTRPWDVHISSFASSFPIRFLTSPCLFCTYHLCFLFPVPFTPFSHLPSPLIPLHVISISVNLFLCVLFA